MREQKSDEFEQQQGIEEEAPPLSEPLIVADLYLTGIGVTLEPQAARFVGWVKAPSHGGETEERRITLRFTMPISGARAMSQELIRELKRAGDH